MVFSGPLQPPLLGAALASAELHLTDELVCLQKSLEERVSYCNRRMKDAQLPLLVDNETPIVFVRLGLPRVANEVAQRLAEDGFYVNVSMYPSVPMKRAGLRLGITATHTFAEIDRVIESLSRHVPAVLAEEGLSRAELDDLFAQSLVSYAHTDSASAKGYVAQLLREANTRTAGAAPQAWSRSGLDCDPAALSVEHLRSIVDVNQSEWDAALGTAACCSWEAMLAAERIFKDQSRKEHNWDFHYVIVRDRQGVPICVTFFTVLLQKDDSLMRDTVSRAVELRRREDPYFLTSKAVVMGSGLSEGNHLYLRREGPWRAALHWVLQTASKICDAAGADVLVLRDLPGDDPEMDEFLLLQGLVKIPNLDSHRLHLTWGNTEEFVRGLGRKAKQQLRNVVSLAPSYDVRICGSSDTDDPAMLTPDERTQLHGLYQNVARKKFRFNTFELPQNLLAGLLESPAWEIGILRLDGRSVAFWAAHKHGAHYAPLFCGLDYEYVAKYGAYRQMIYQFALRAKSLGMEIVHLGMDAEIEKRRFGAVAHKTCMYGQARADFNAALLREIVAEVGVQDAQRA
jgi:hypothetical protein